MADALRLGGAVLGPYPNMLAPQLIGRLLPETAPNPNIKMLLNDCDLKGPTHCALLPLYHCLHTPGGPLKVNRKLPPKSITKTVSFSTLWKVINLQFLQFALHPITVTLYPFPIVS